MAKKARLRFVLYSIILLLLLPLCDAWEWSDVLALVAGESALSSNKSTNNGGGTTFLSMAEVSSLRVRDIKRRLTRTHGFDASEVGRMLDKKELIETLAFEEHKVRQQYENEVKRQLVWNGLLVTLGVGALTLFWPLLKHAWEIGSVNFVVYTDRKFYEAKRCWETKALLGTFLIVLMAVLDMAQLWMSISILLSWFMKSKYFFPMPSIPVHPAAFMGGPISQGPLAKYGLNVAPMAIGWLFRYLQSLLERWAGNELKKAFKRQRQQQRQEQRQQETPEERTARKAAKRAAKAAKQQQQQQEKEEEPSIRAFTPEEMRANAAAAAEQRRANLETNTPLDDLD